MAMEDDPDLINDPDRQLEAKAFQQAEKYQASRVRSRNENKVKADGRKEIEKLGFDTDAYQVSLRVARDKTPAEQRKWVRDLKFFLKIFGNKQQELWPEDAAKAEARAKRKREKAAKAAAAAGKETPEQQERRLAADTNPRSDPNRGGAKPRTGRKAKDNVVNLNRAPLASDAEKVAADEQKTGGEILDGALQQIKDAGGEPKSQSAQAAEKRDEAGIP